MTFIGIDPGMSGGLGVIVTEPVTASNVIPFGKLTEHEIIKTIQWRDPHGIFIVIENVHAFPGQGVSSTFKFGKNFGLLLGGLYAFGHPFELVTPQKWQKEIGCMTGGDKNISKTKAQQLFPNLTITHATADAILIAEYCRRMVLRRNGQAVA